MAHLLDATSLKPSENVQQLSNPERLRILFSLWHENSNRIYQESMSRRTLTEMNKCLEKFYESADIKSLETPSRVRILFQENANVAIRDGWGW